MKTFAVACASPATMDHGMLLVDLGFVKALRSLGSHGAATFRCAELVANDSRHVSANGRREGVPVIGKGVAHVESSLSDKKKEVLFNQIFAAHPG